MDVDDLEFGLFLPRWSERATPTAWRRIARAADDCGYDYVGRGDHIVFPVGESGSWSAETNAADPFAVLSYVAGITEHVRIGTNICVVPYRHPVHLAKLALTLDSLSDGRFEFGVAVGWLEAEFRALDVPFEERGSRTNEFLQLFERVCEESVVSFEGPHHAFEDVGFNPRPIQEGGPTVMVGGSSPAAFRRLARFGDGWLITATPSELADDREQLLAAWRDADREGEPAVAVGQQAYVGTDSDEAGPLVGSPDAVREGVRAYAEAGATRIDCKFQGTTADVDEQVEQIERFADEVLEY